jgi:hypothetical protein
MSQVMFEVQEDSGSGRLGNQLFPLIEDILQVYGNYIKVPQGSGSGFDVVVSRRRFKVTSFLEHQAYYYIARQDETRRDKIGTRDSVQLHFLLL